MSTTDTIDIAAHVEIDDDGDTETVEPCEVLNAIHALLDEEAYGMTRIGDADKVASMVVNADNAIHYWDEEQTSLHLAEWVDPRQGIVVLDNPNIWRVYTFPDIETAASFFETLVSALPVTEADWG